MTEDYCDFETAMLLKEKGFNELTTKAYPYFEGKDYKYDISCPTLQMAMKWLREVHKIDIDIDVYSKHSWCDSTDYCTSIFSHGHRIMVEKNEVFDAYEEAAEAAIKYCLENLIK